MNLDLFFEKLFINSELADNICSDLSIKRSKYTTLSIELEEERRNIKRSRSLYNNKKRLENFNFSDFNSFYKWHKSQHETQKGKCYYCQTDELVIATVFEKKYQNRKRTTRGKHLEVERRDSTKNSYDKDNCVLACYFCNNDKSDIFDEHEYLDYLRDRKSFFTSQLEKLNGNR